jgi:hypothetical protein
LPASGKAQKLIEDGAKVVNAEFQPNLVCVVDNGFFEAAGYCFNENEFEAFNSPSDPRPKIWLVHPDAENLAK